MDFYTVRRKTNKREGSLTIYPDFKIGRFNDFMVRGKAFYAVYDEQTSLWSTDEYSVRSMIDAELDAECDRVDGLFLESDIHVAWASSYDSKTWKTYREWIKQLPDNYHQLDDKLIFANSEVKKEDYASRRLPYPLAEGDYSAFDEIIGTLYSEEERAKLEWAIGSVIAGDSKTIQKFVVLYGEAGAGKSTILNIIQKLFEGYYTTFEAKALASNNNTFSTEVFRSNPLVAIQHDGDLSKIEDNTKLNSIISHEEMNMNEKYKSSYTVRLNCFLFMATNRPVKITDAKSGIIRRLIDVRPSGNKIEPNRYSDLMDKIDFELGAIAYHCLQVYKSMGRNYYSAYRPTDMMFKTDAFFNFVEDSYLVFDRQDGVSLKQAYDMYRTYCDEAQLEYKLTKYKFREELKNYFRDFYGVTRVGPENKQVRNYYGGFLREKFSDVIVSEPKLDISEESDVKEEPRIALEASESPFDTLCCDCPAQYATSNETPSKKWSQCLTKLSDIKTNRLHYVKVPENHIVIDFDLKGPNGEKSADLNLKAAAKWPATYAEFSKGGAGVHLHYIYDGDPKKLSCVYSEGIEIKVFTGNSALRRRLSKCNDLPVAHIYSGLPLKGDKKMLNFSSVKSEKALRTLILKNLQKEYHPGTKPSIDFIYKILEDAYNSELPYDVTDLRPKVMAFANNSSHQASYCLKMVDQMKFKSENYSDSVTDYEDQRIVFFDIEVYPNLFLVNWKYQGDGASCVRMINPSPQDIEELMKMKLVGFNCRRYDNHILYARYLGYSNIELYDLSQRIISGSRNAFFGEAYNISYTDVYDFASKKQSLKKWEIELHIHHKEMGLPWDEPVPEDKWVEVAEYCDNDVIATEAVFNACLADFEAREILVDLVKKVHNIDNVSVNDTTNSLSAKLIFGRERKPQGVFNWRDLSKPVGPERYEEYVERFGEDYKFRLFDSNGLPMYRDYIPGEELKPGQSILPFFPGYKFEFGKSTYLGEEIGEGGRVYSEPGMYSNVWDGDIASQHPHSAIFECVFGPEYTKRFEDIVNARVAIKHKDFDLAGKMFEGALKPYLNAERASKLAYALKIVINSVYGMTSAKFENVFRDPNNIDNIVAKRGALFMTFLKSQVQKMGYKVCHIKTDSIKIPNADKVIKDFVIRFGAEYGYTFETEAEFDKYCLVNDAVYIACEGNEWTAIGAQFKQPYVFKTLFSKEPIEFDDLCETKEVKSALYLDMNEKLPDVSAYEKELKKVLKEHKDAEKEGKIYPTDRIDELQKLISEGHSYSFIGKVGSFCPVKKGCGGGLLVRGADGKYFAATGTTGYRWLEAETVKNCGMEDDIDLSYYNKLVDAAKDTISEFGDFEWFVERQKEFDPETDVPWCTNPEVNDPNIETCAKCDIHDECLVVKGMEVNDGESIQSV